MLANLLIGASEPEVNFDSVTITLNNPNTYGVGTNDYFGYAVAISENYAVVAAPHDSDASGTYSGKVYVYDVVNGTLLRTFVNPNPYGTSDNDFFGRSVDVYGDIVVVGAYNEDEASNDNSGKAYIFSISNNALMFTLNNPNAFGTAANDLFGIRVAVHGNLMIAGAYQEDSTSSYTNAGKAYIFSVASGTLLFTLNDPNVYGTPKDDYFGWSVDICEKYAIVGAYGEDESGRSTSGKAYVFDVNTGLLLVTLNNPNAYGTAASDYFGWVVSISGEYAAVGAYQEDDASGTSSGKVYIFNASTGALLRTINNPNPYGTSANDFFGYHLAIHGKYVIVGAYQEDQASNTNSGKAYVFDITTGDLVKTFNNPNGYNTASNDYFGFNVGICGRRAIVGAYAEDDANGTSSGKAYIFY